MSSLVVMTDPRKQRRSAVRFPLQFPVIFNWHEEEKHTGGGFTCNVSLDGALIKSMVCPPVGCEVFIELLVPSPNIVGEQLRVQCTGKVSRVTEEYGGYKFGVRGSFDDRITRHLGL